jgi:hypothetical protein
MKKIKQFFATEDLFARHTGIELLEVGPGWSKASIKFLTLYLNWHALRKANSREKARFEKTIKN